MAQRLQIIDGVGNFASTDTKGSQSLTTFIKKNYPEFLTKGEDYSVVAVLGGQSTGKSTLLNLLFDTSFQVLNAETRGRTTLGVWLSFPENAPERLKDKVVVLDVEGTDSTQRDDNNNFERRAGLFTLSISSAFIINIKQKEIGRGNASNFTLIKTILELNLQLFQREKSNKILLIFVVRDFSGKTPFDRVKEILFQELMATWSKIQKPDAFITSMVTDFFEIRYDYLPDPFSGKKDFAEGIARIKDKFFDENTEDSYLDPSYRRTGIPSDGFAQYANEIWTTIQQNKDLDIPSQKHLLAEYRCDAIAKEVKENIDKLITEALKKYENGNSEFYELLGKDSDSWIEQALADYEKQTTYYLGEVRDEKRSAMLEEISKSLYHIFNTAYSRLYKSLLEKYMEQFSKLASAVIDDLKEARSNLSTLNTIDFANRNRAFLDELTQEWKHKFSSLLPTRASLENWDIAHKEGAFAEELEKKYRKQVVFVYKYAKELLSTLLKTRFLIQVERALDCNDETWARVRAARDECIEFIGNAVARFLTCGLGMTDKECSEECATLRAELDAGIRDAASVRAHSANYRMLAKFEQLFKYDVRGLPRRWKANDNVLEVFTKARIAAERVLDTLCYIRLRDSDDEVRFTKLETIDLGNGARDADLFVLEVPETEDYQPENVLLTVDERFNFLNLFRMEVKDRLEKALQEQEAIRTNVHIPFIFIVFFCCISFNEFRAIISNPLYLFFALILMSTIFMVYKIGLGSAFEKLMYRLFSVSLSAAFKSIRAIIYRLIPFNKGKTKAVNECEMDELTPYEDENESKKER